MRELKRSIYFISFPMAFIAFILPIYASSIGASVMEIGYLYSIFSVVSIIIRPAIGELIDRRGRRLGILIGIVFYTMVNFIFLFGDSFNHLMVARILQSIAGSFLWISVDTVISDISNKENRGRNFGSIDETGTKGQMMGSFIGLTIIFNSYSDRPFKLIFTIFSVTSLVSLYYGIKNIPETMGSKKKREKSRVKEKKNLISFLLVIGVISFIMSITAPIYILYMKDNITNNLSLISFLFIPGSILAMVLPSKFGTFSDKYGKERIILLGLFFSSILQFFIPLNKSFYGFMIIYTMISVVGMFYSPALSAIIIDFVGEEKRGRTYGRYAFATGIGSSIGPIVGSFIYTNLGNNIVFYVKGSLLIALTVFLFYNYMKSYVSVKGGPKINVERDLK